MIQDGRVITGYNTDIEHKDQVFHVQTEDRGVENPVIESLIYMGGKIIAQRQYSYAWLLRQGYTEEAVQELVDSQHRKMGRDIRGGKYDPEGPPPFGAGIISNRTFDEVALEFIEEKLETEGIEVSVEEPPAPRAGELLVLEPMVTSDLTGRPVAGAAITVQARRAGSDRGVVLFEGKTGRKGHISAGVDLPGDYGGGILILHAKGLNGEDSIEWEIAKS